MTEAEKRLHRCCFTGHRPEKLKKSESELGRLLEQEIQKAVDLGFTTFISGGAKGTDIIAAEIVLRVRQSDPRLKLICALPHEGFGEHWERAWTERFHRVLNEADLVRYVSRDFSYASYQVRNEWMVRHSTLVIAVYNGGKGGTKNTLAFAKAQNIPCVIIEDRPG